MSEPADAAADTAAESSAPAVATSEPAELKAARQLLFRERFAVLSTISIHHDGCPYGSVTPYALSREGLPLLLVSTIAAHTQNLKADGRCSLFVQEHPRGEGATLAGWDPQALARMTLMGRAAPVPDAEIADARARYLCRLPQAEEYFGTHDFVFYQVAFEKVRLIGGFGKISWVDGQRFRRPPEQDPLARAAAGILGHMNDDHGEALRLYCQGLRGMADVTSARMVGIDALGFDVLAAPGERQVHFEFDDELTTADAVRKALVAMVKDARQRLSTASAGPAGQP
jgi:putative heme iron utilization protein